MLFSRTPPPSESSEDDVKAAAVVIASTVYELAMRDELLPRFSAEEMPAPAHRVRQFPREFGAQDSNSLPGDSACTPCKTRLRPTSPQRQKETTRIVSWISERKITQIVNP